MRLQDLQNNTTQELAEGYGKYYCSTDKKWKERQGPKQTRKVSEGSKYKCTCHPGDPDPDCAVHGLEPMDVGDALDIKEMDKSASQPGRDGKVSHSTYGSRDKKGSDYFKGKEAPSKPITKKQMEKDVLDQLKKQGVAEGAPIVVALAPIDIRNPKKAAQPYRNQGDIVPDTKPPSTEKRGVKGRAGQRPMPKQDVAEVSTELRNRYVTRASDDYGFANFAARASKDHPGLDDYSREQEQRAKKRAAGLNRALSDKRTGRDETEVDEASLATMRNYFAGDENAKDPTKLSLMRDYFNKNKPEGKVIDKNFNSVASYNAWLKQQNLKKISGVSEDDKTDRMVQHIIKSEKAAGKSAAEAEDIAWATVNKRGMLESNNFAEPVKSALGQAIVTVEGMRSVREGEPGIKRVTRKRVDDSVEVRYHVLDSDGVTRKVFDDLSNAKAWLSANRADLHKD